MNLNQHSIIGFLGKNAEIKHTRNGKPVVKFSVATTKRWKNQKDETQEKTQWHNVVAYGESFAKFANRLVTGTHVFVQGQSTTREYDFKIKVPVGKNKSVEHTIQKLIMELVADTVYILDRSTATDEVSNAAEPPIDDEATT